jgi:hypothetical protein
MGPLLANRDLPGLRPERRRYQRHALPCECWLESDELTIFGPTIDVGIGGLFLRTGIPVAQGTVVDVTLKVSNDLAPFEAKALVTRSVAARTGLRYGVGVEFLDPGPRDNALLALLQRTYPLPWL